MIREMLNGTIRAGLANIELNDLKEPDSNIKTVELAFKDSLSWKALPDRLRIECTRNFSFKPECNFELKITYFVEHYLREEGSLEQLTGEEIKNEITSDFDFYLQENQGFAARMSLLAAQITSTFGGVPAITPPIFPFSQENSKV